MMILRAGTRFIDPAPVRNFGADRHAVASRIENLVQQARVVIGEFARRHYAYQVLQADEKLHSLGEISQSLSLVTNVES